LGCGKPGTANDIRAIKSHPFFKGFVFETIEQQKVPVPLHLLMAKKTTVKKKIPGNASTG
jgi:hypothetical protein